MSFDAKARAEALNALALASADFPMLTITDIIHNAVDYGDYGISGISDEDLARCISAYRDRQLQKEENYNEWKKEKTQSRLIF